MRAILTMIVKIFSINVTVKIIKRTAKRLFVVLIS